MSFHRVVLFPLLLPILAPAQAPSVAATIASSFGVAVHDGVPHAGGPGYAVVFDASGPVYTPVGGGESVGPAAPPASVRLQFREAVVGDERLAVGGDVLPRVEGAIVSYARGLVVETYEVRSEGVKQCFVVGERPTGDGDLRVRMRIDTALPLVRGDDDEVRFARADGFGVSLGAVLGIDGSGATVRGSMRCDGDVLELGLPASFVRSACYPLVLDPLVGTVFSVGDDPTHDDVTPSIAYDAGTGRFLVVWAVRFPGANAHSEIRGQFVTPGGGNIGLQILIANDAYADAEPEVVTVNSSNRFLVGWSGPTPTSPFQFPGILVRAVTASNGAMSSEVTVTGALGDSYDGRIGLGGDSRTGFLAGTHALVAYRRLAFGGGSNELYACRVQVPSTGDPVPATAVSVAVSSNLLDDLSVSAHCGTAGRWMMTFGQSVTSINGPMQRIVGQVVAASGALCGTPETIANTGVGGDVKTPVVATRDGNEFVFAWHDDVANTVQVRRVVVGGACGSTTWTADAIVSPLTNPGQAIAPAIAFVADKYLLAYQQYQSGWRVFTRSLDPATCGTCGAEQRVDSPQVVLGTPAVGSAYEGGAFTDGAALVAWCEGGAVKARNWQLHGTAGVTGLGGGCGLTGFNDFATYNGQAVLGADDFEVLLLNPTAPVLALVLGFSANPFACGPCTLIPSQDVIVPSLVSATIPIPCVADLVGAELYVQWVQVRPSGCPIYAGYGLSNCLKFTVAE